MKAAVYLPKGNRTTSFGEQLASWIERNEALVVVAVIARFAISMVRYSRRPLWFDELFTYFISRLNLADMMRAMPADGQPPLNYLLAGAFLRFTSNAELAVRIPSILGFIGALLAIYFFVRRRFGAVPALFGMLVAATSSMAYYATEARPYALMLGFTGLTLVSWQAATSVSNARSRFVPLAGVAVGIAGAVVTHHYGVVYVGLPLIFGEAARLIERRRLDWPIYFACAAGLSLLAVSLPLAAKTHLVMLDYVQGSSAFWAKPNGWQLFSYFKMVEWWVPLIAIAAFWMAKPEDEVRAKLRRMPRHEWAAAWGSALLVVVILCVAAVATGYFLPRYAIGAVIGISILAAAWLASAGHGTRRGIVAAALCVPVMIAASFFPFHSDESRVVNGRLVTPSEPETVRMDLEFVPGPDPIVVASALSYMPIWWYSSETLRGRLHYLADLPYAVRQADFLPELSLVANQKYVASKVDDFDQFTSSHRNFYVYCTDASRLEWTKDRLAKENWTLSLVQRGWEDQLFWAQAPGQ